jgi:glycosyltransferase involved in cell wall biosynthesis
MKISIALAVFNGTNYLDEQLASFLTQTRLPDELVAVDDSSTDKTVEALENFARKAPFPVQILCSEQNQGSTISFERAINACSGDLIFPSDHDDIWLPSKLERIAERFDDSPGLGLYFGNAELIDERGEPIGRAKISDALCEEIQYRIRKGEFVERLLVGNVVGGATSAFRADLCKFLLPLPRLSWFIHDGWIGVILGSIREVEFSADNLMQYRQHTSQQIGVVASSKIQRVDRSIMCENAVAAFGGRLSDSLSVLERLREIKELEPNNPYLPKAINAVEDSINKFEDAVEHFRARHRLPPNRLMRIGKVFKEGFTGRYGKYSSGIKSAVKDLMVR